MKLMSKFAFLRALALVAGVVALSSGFASAQSGTFKLPVESKWGKAVLPAGKYSYTMDERVGKILTIRSMANGAAVMVMADSVSQSQPERDQLTLTRRGNEAFVTALSLGDYGMVLNYAIPKMKAIASTASVPMKGQATLASASKQ